MSTFEDYKLQIQQHYQQVVLEDNTSVLINPSPAQLRDLCLYIVEKGISKSDEEVFKAFFETKENMPIQKSIENCNTDKFKTIIAFLKQITDASMNLRVEVAAILVAYPYRPYAKFRKQHEVIAVISKEKESLNNEVKKSISDTNTEIKNSNSSIKKKVVLGAIGVLGAFGVGNSIYTNYVPKKDCMYWNKDHYETVACDCEPQGFLSTTRINPINETVFTLKRIYPCDTTTFFNDYGEPQVWYHKKNNKLEYFNQDGNHPITGKDLRPITKYMIKAHHLDQKTDE